MGPVKAIDARRMRSNFSAQAGRYDRYAAVQRRVVAELCARMDRFGPLTGPVLDVGTGTGALAEALGGRLADGRLTVMDIAHGMTLQASRRLGRVAACDADAVDLPFRDGSFRMLVSSSVYQWVADLPAAFSEVRRVLQPGGGFAVALFGEQTLCELRDSHRRAVASCREGSLSHVQSFPSCDEVLQAVQAADLDCLEIDAYPEIEWHDDVPALLRQLKQIGAGNASRNRPRGLASRRVMQEMMALYEENFRRDQGLPATYEVIVVIARRKTS